MDMNARIFLNSRSDDDAVLRAISHMTPSSAPATLWTQVANDPSYRLFHRAVAVHELFKRHVAKPVTLKQLALVLDNGHWLLDAVVEKIELMGGEIPVQVPAGGAAYIIRLREDPAVADSGIGMYLALDRAIDSELLRDALMSKVTDPSVLQLRIMDFAPFPESLVVMSDQ